MEVERWDNLPPDAEGPAGAAREEDPRFHTVEGLGDVQRFVLYVSSGLPLQQEAALDGWATLTLREKNCYQRRKMRGTDCPNGIFAGSWVF